MFDKFREVRLFVKESKTSLFQTNIKWLGHWINATGIQVDPEKAFAIINWLTPQTAKELKQFLGLCSYYQKVVQNFSEITKPLHKFAANKAK